MSLATLLSRPPEIRRCPRGRPRASESPATRDLHVAVALRWKLGKIPRSQVMKEFGVSRDTVRRWYLLALTYEGTLPDLLREMKRVSP